MPGLYRIRRASPQSLDYIGQTGKGKMTLRRRLAMLKGIYGLEMPYRDPHTAAPALWALLHRDSIPFEVSVCPITGSTPWRKGLEALALAMYRQVAGESPTANFGRMPRGYRMSSPNNKRIVDAGMRFRGGPTREVLDSHVNGVPPAGPIDSDPLGREWCGHTWSEWTSVDEALMQVPAAGRGLYRLRGSGRNELVYIGEGRLRSRLKAHSRRVNDWEHPQGRAFAAAGSLECSWVIDDSWHDHQRLELETDLIGSQVLVTGQVPAAQFLGGR